MSSQELSRSSYPMSMSVWIVLIALTDVGRRSLKVGGVIPWVWGLTCTE